LIATGDSVDFHGTAIEEHAVTWEQYSGTFHAWADNPEEIAETIYLL
jgi:hypothetical protein